MFSQQSILNQVAYGHLKNWNIFFRKEGKLFSHLSASEDKNQIPQIAFCNMCSNQYEKFLFKVQTITFNGIHSLSPPKTRKENGIGELKFATQKEKKE